MIKYKYVLLCNGLALWAVFLFLNLGWQMQTVLGAPQTRGQEQFSQTYPNQLSVREQLNTLFPGTMAGASRQYANPARSPIAGMLGPYAGSLSTPV